MPSGQNKDKEKYLVGKSRRAIQTNTPNTAIKHQSEAQIQAQIIQYLQSQKIYFHSVPNEAASDNKIRQMQLIAIGLRSGVADLVVWWPWGIGYMEVKTPKGVLSDRQKIFRSKCLQAKIPYCLVRSVADVKAYIREMRVAMEVRTDGED